MPPFALGRRTGQRYLTQARKGLVVADAIACCLMYCYPSIGFDFKRRGSSRLRVVARFQIQRTILDQWLDNSDLITTPDQAADLEARMADLVSKNPRGPQVISLQLARANLMLRFDHQEGLALLEELAKAPDQNLAVAAKVRLLKSQMIGRAVDLQFTALDGSSFDMQALRGKVVLVDFWASWCPDCIREMPAVRQTYQKYKDKGFAVVGISLDKDAQAQRGEVVSTDLSVEQLDQRIEQLLR